MNQSLLTLLGGIVVFALGIILRRTIGSPFGLPAIGALLIIFGLAMIGRDFFAKRTLNFDRVHEFGLLTTISTADIDREFAMWVKKERIERRRHTRVEAFQLFLGVLLSDPDRNPRLVAFDPKFFPDDIFYNITETLTRMNAPVTLTYHDADETEEAEILQYAINGTPYTSRALNTGHSYEYFNLFADLNERFALHGYAAQFVATTETDDEAYILLDSKEHAVAFVAAHLIKHGGEYPITRPSEAEAAEWRKRYEAIYRRSNAPRSR